MNLFRMGPLRFGTFLLLVGLLATTLSAQNLEPSAANKPAPAPKDPSLVVVQETPGLPRVLLIGDSISMGYTLPVRAKLKGIANVLRPLENCGDTARGLSHLDKWLGKGPWDVIHFNFGLHDLKYLDAAGKYVDPDKGKQVAPPELYRQRLRELTQRLQATGAKLIFATTTPVPEGTLGRLAGGEARYNQVAVEVMKELKVPLDDLGAYVAEQQRKLPPRPLSEKPAQGKRLDARPGEIQLPYNVHFTRQGYEQLAELVTSSIRSALP
jgi:acyl-CoA thioesterase-1